jgi:beta-glucuronidase
MKAKTNLLLITCLILIFNNPNSVYAQTAMTNVSARHCTSLNGKWHVILDPTGIGNWREIKKTGEKDRFC